jgi:phenylpyruvate tautomerase PptA (4-oxalocrotonate tautomerase family)
MPFYTATTQDGVLSAKQKQTISEEITRIHCAATGAPRSFVRVLFLHYPADGAFSGGKAGPLAVLSGQIRAGRDVVTKQKMLAEYWEMFARETGSPVD